MPLSMIWAAVSSASQLMSPEVGIFLQDVSKLCAHFGRFSKFVFPASARSSSFFIILFINFHGGIIIALFGGFHFLILITSSGSKPYGLSDSASASLWAWLTVSWKIASSSLLICSSSWRFVSSSSSVSSSIISNLEYNWSDAVGNQVPVALETKGKAVRCLGETSRTSATPRSLHFLLFQNVFD